MPSITFPHTCWLPGPVIMPLRQQIELHKIEDEPEDPAEAQDLVETQLHWGEEESTPSSSSSSSVSSSYSVLFLETLEEEDEGSVGSSSPQCSWASTRLWSSIGSSSSFSILRSSFC